MRHNPPFTITSLRPRRTSRSIILPLAPVSANAIRNRTSHQINHHRMNIHEREIIEAMEWRRQHLLESLFVLVGVVGVEGDDVLVGEEEVGVGRAELVDGVGGVGGR